jgi:hypothetical protein
MAREYLSLGGNLRKTRTLLCRECYGYCNITAVKSPLIYGANHLVTATFGQAQNHLEVKTYTFLLYIGINKAIICNDFDAM